jgi:3-hydroxyacyl-CoA dehydrogenase
MERAIRSVAVIGAGTMGSGIAAACAAAGCDVLLFDTSRELVERARERMIEGRSPILDDAAALSRIRSAVLPGDRGLLAQSDWICESIVEDLAAKRDLFQRIEPLRREGSVVSTNTSGIPLRDILEGMPERLQRETAVTHFFNPVKVMRLVELIPGPRTEQGVLDRLADLLANRLGKGVVHAKDTVNFIGNRIGCFWMLAGLHKAGAALSDDLPMEKVDALLGRPLGIPPTGLYGLIDLIGLDVMDLVARNLAANLPERDPGRDFVSLPPPERRMLTRGQLGRKSGGGFYRISRHDDGSRARETFNLRTEAWRPSLEVDLDPSHQSAETLLFSDDQSGRLVLDLMGATLCYAADLVPDISDDLVNVDRAMRWGFNWRHGPFELLDRIGPDRLAERLEAEGRPLPRMLAVLRRSGAGGFYRNESREQLGPDGDFHPVP